MTSVREHASPGASKVCVECGAAEPEASCQFCGCPQRPGGYDVLRLVSREPWGRIFRAQDEQGRQFIVRELVFSRAATAAQIEAFEREALMLGSLNHPAVPKLVRSFREGAGEHQRLYLAYTHAEGASLIEQMKSHRFDEREARAIARKLLELLDYLHRLSPPVLHRDIKAANVLYDRGDHLTLLGFGSAIELGGRATVELPPEGCVGHVAPEQRVGQATVQSDLYGVGVTLLELLARRSPDEILNTNGLRLDAHVNVSPAMRRFLEALLAPDPHARPASARDALALLDSENRQVSKRERGLLQRAWRARRLVAGALAGLMLTWSWGYAIGRGQATVRVTPLSLTSSSERHLPVIQTTAQALEKASVGGKYSNLLRKVDAAEDRGRYGDFNDYGHSTTGTYAGQTSLPPAYWVYVYPSWYLWEQQNATTGVSASGRWGTNQVLGAPNTQGAGDIDTAWASKTADGQREWLETGFDQPVVATEVHIHETFNPGALTRLVGITPAGVQLELWKGVASAAGVPRRELVVPLTAPTTLQTVFLELDSPAVPGWNEIDAVGLRASDGTMHWASSARASSTYAK